MEKIKVECEHFIPFRVSDLLQLCLDADEMPSQHKRRFEKICVLLTRYYHLTFHRKLSALKDSYAPFNPDSDTLPIEQFSESALRDKQSQLRDVLVDVVIAANFKPVRQEDLDKALEEESLFNIRLNVDFDDFDQILFYRRGESIGNGEVRKWYSWKTTPIQFTNYERVLIYVKFKEQAYFDARGKTELFFKPGTTMLKLFRNIPKADLEMLFPNTEVAMRVQDKIMIGVPAAVSGAMVLVTKLGSTILLLSAMFAFWLGWRDEPVFIDQAALIALGVGMASLGAYLWKQFSAFRNRKIRFMKVLADNLYFKNLDNNAGVFHRLVDAAEEAESKEAMLAYFFLVTVDEAMTEKQLDERIEQWLSSYGGTKVDFEVDDAVNKLVDLGLVVRKEQGDKQLLEAVDLDDALDGIRAACHAAVSSME